MSRSHILLSCLIAGVLAVGAVNAQTGNVAPAAPMGEPLTEADRQRLLGEGEVRVPKMQATLATVEERAQVAKDEKDVIRINCISERLSAVRGLVKIGELSLDGLREAVREKVDDLVRHEHTKIVLAGNKVDAYRTEVDGCAGELSLYTGVTEVEATIDPDIREDDPTEGDVIAYEPIDTVRPPSVTGNE